MPQQYTVKQGECIMSIAEKFGFRWETIWNHPDNADLKRVRKDPNILFPGDIAVIPDKNPRIETVPTDQLSRFMKKMPPAQVRLRLLDMKRKPRANVDYTATAEGAISSGKSDGDGYITIPVPHNARELRVSVTEGSKTDEYTLPLGSIDPIDELSGVQQRLENLGYPCGSEQGTPGERTKAALRAFQKEVKLDVTGRIDDATLVKLKQMHGC